MSEKLRLMEIEINNLRIINQEQADVIIDDKSAQIKILSKVLRNHGKYNKGSDIRHALDSEMITMLKIEANKEIPKEIKAAMEEAIESYVNTTPMNSYANVTKNGEFTTVLGKKANKK